MGYIDGMLLDKLVLLGHEYIVVDLLLSGCPKKGFSIMRGFLGITYGFICLNVANSLFDVFMNDLIVLALLAIDFCL
jgi:hypothetical protein